MLLQEREHRASPARVGHATQSLTIFVEDMDAHFQRAKAAGAKIVEQLHETGYGELQYGAEDLGGHHWLFSRHARDVSPEQWGAKVAQATNRVALLPKPRLCYIEIPALDVHASAAFYEKVFGWNIRRRETDHPCFDDANGDVSGAWVSGREIARTLGLLPYIWVDGIDETLKLIAAQGGSVVEQPHLDSPGGCWITTFRDPSGNVMGLYQEGER